MKRFFCRNIPVRYWHAEAIVSKRVKNFVDTRVAFFDAATQDEAARGLRNLILNQHYRQKPSRMSIRQQKAYVFIPFWHPACWSEKRRHRYMLQRGFFREDCH